MTVQEAFEAIEHGICFESLGDLAVCRVKALRTVLDTLKVSLTELEQLKSGSPITEETDPVTYCMDCKHYDPDWVYEMKPRCCVTGQVMEPCGYCSLAEPKEDYPSER